MPDRTLTLMPAHRSNRWHTEGIVAYAHLALDADLLARLAHEEFDRQPGEILLLDKVGAPDPLVAELMLALCQEARIPGRDGLYRGSLRTALAIALLKRHSTLGAGGRQPLAARDTASGGLAGWQLRRVREYMQANLLRDITIDELVGKTRGSRAHFFRTFRRSTGDTPARHLQRLRMRHAADLLQAGHPVATVAGIVGYGSSSHFASAFRSVIGANPSEWGRRQRAERDVSSPVV